MALPLEGKVAIVTGSSRGIGKAIALQLAQDGADIAVCARSFDSSESPLGTIGATAEMVEAGGRRAIAIKVDVTDDDQVRAMIDRTLAELGRIDIVVNNAARLGTPAPPFWGGGPEIMDEFYRTNLRAPYFITQLVSGQMETLGGGTIINITSGGARQPGPPPEGGPRPSSPGSTHVGYGATKAALNRWAAGVAGDLKAHGIAIICVDPGLTVVERNIANPRPGADYSNAEQPETTGKAVAFLCRDAMQFTGQVFNSRQLVDKYGL
jgi:NAD(P)-dependent dehydrogenase (short-subunit alcohol dehydrogenase family)